MLSGKDITCKVIDGRKEKNTFLILKIVILTTADNYLLASVTKIVYHNMRENLIYFAT